MLKQSFSVPEFIKCAHQYWTPVRLEKILHAKKYLLTPSNAPVLLRSLNLLNADASMSIESLNKFIQINHMLSLLQESFEDLSKRHPKVCIIDAGCGKSYLTFLLAWYFKEVLKKDAEIIGIDTNVHLIRDCEARAQFLGYENNLKFVRSSISTFPFANDKRLHALISLHACDTASDMTLAFGIQHKADFIAVSPCCQAELARQWKNLATTHKEHPLLPVFNTPQIRREIAAHFTDTLRMLLVRANGYEVTATEFVPSQHTAKNRLISCIRRGNYLQSAQNEYETLKIYLGGAKISLESLLKSNNPENTEI